MMRYLPRHLISQLLEEANSCSSIEEMRDKLRKKSLFTGESLNAYMMQPDGRWKQLHTYVTHVEPMENGIKLLVAGSEEREYNDVVVMGIHGTDLVLAKKEDLPSIEKAKQKSLEEMREHVKNYRCKMPWC